MSIQFGRVVEVQVDTVLIEGLSVSFRVVKTLDKDPNTCELTIFNLGQQRREELAQTKEPVVRVAAGYSGRRESDSALAAVDDALGIPKESVGVIFLGKVRHVNSNYENPNWLTQLESGDGEAESRLARINKSFAAGTSLSTAFKEAARSMGLGLGNAARAIERGNLLEAGTEFLTGLVLSGPARKELDRLAKSSGLEWSIQEGVLQVLEHKKPLQDVSVVLTPETGLIGSPTIGSDGVIRARALINSDIVPGRQIELESKAVKGRFRAERCEYVGSNFDTDFYVEIEAAEL